MDKLTCGQKPVGNGLAEKHRHETAPITKNLLHKFAFWFWLKRYQLEEWRNQLYKSRRYIRWWLVSGLLILAGGAP